jgi:hypothetical protein
MQEGGNTGSLSAYSPEEADTHYHRYNGRRSLSALHDDEEEKQEVRIINKSLKLNLKIFIDFPVFTQFQTNWPIYDRWE